MLRLVLHDEWSAETGAALSALHAGRTRADHDWLGQRQVAVGVLERPRRVRARVICRHVRAERRARGGHEALARGAGPVRCGGPQRREERADDLHDVVCDEQRGHVRCGGALRGDVDEDELREGEHDGEDEVGRGGPEKPRELVCIGVLGSHQVSSTRENKTGQLTVTMEPRSLLGTAYSVQKENRYVSAKR